jgi:hypothetical protein
MAYVSDSSGRYEVYARRMDGDDEVWRISTEGGRGPYWSKSGRELFYVDLASRMMAVPTTMGASLSVGEPMALFPTTLDESSGRQYDVSPDGQRFLLNQSAATATNPIIVVRDWGPEIERMLGK